MGGTNNRVITSGHLRKPPDTGQAVVEGFPHEGAGGNATGPFIRARSEAV